MEKRYKVKAVLHFFSSEKTARDAEKKLQNLEFKINKVLLTSTTEVLKINIIGVEKLPF